MEGGGGAMEGWRKDGGRAAGREEGGWGRRR